MTEQNNLGWKEPLDPIRSSLSGNQASFKVGTNLKSSIRLLKALSGRVLDVSKDGDSTALLGNLSNV